MSAPAWPAVLARRAVQQLSDLPTDVQELVRDVLDIAARDPWSWPAWDDEDPEGEDLRLAAAGQVEVLYRVNRIRGHPWVMDVTAPLA